jgi:hypothetical protein
MGLTGFAAGTLIRTAHGEVAVESLKVGDQIITARDEARPVAWLGSRALRRPDRESWPIRVRAGAFADNLPARDLVLSPDHSILVKVMDEIFLPAAAFANGATVVQEMPEEFTYWLVGLETPDVIVAEGLKTESCLADAAELPADQAGSPQERARPLVTKGPVIVAARQRLVARAEALGWTRKGEMDLDLHLRVDGVRYEPDIDGDLARFVFPAAATEVAIVSKVFLPAWKIGNRDARELGACLTRLKVMDGLRVEREIAVDDPELVEGFHEVERSEDRAWRWTSGRGVLPPSLWAGSRDRAILRVEFNPRGGWSWVAPTKAVAESSPETEPLRAVS